VECGSRGELDELRPHPNPSPKERELEDRSEDCVIDEKELMIMWKRLI
jgi:hypothetical protein